MTGGIARMAAPISADLVARLPRQNKKPREGLALLVATMLEVRSANLMDIAASLPRDALRIDMRYQWISRWLGNELIDVDAVMAPFAREVLARAAADGRSIALIIDQTKANETQQAIVVAPSSVWFVVNGTGRTEVAEKPLAWSERDSFVIPNWAPHRLVNGSETADAILFSVNDRPAVEALGLFREGL